MKAVLWLALILAVAGGAFGQHAGRVGGGFGDGQRGVNPGIPPVHPIPPLGPTGRGFPVALRPSPGRNFFTPAFPLFLGGYDYGYPEYSPAPNVVIIQQFSPSAPVQETPREPVKSEIREYRQPAVTTAPLPQEEQPAFAIVLKDGSVHSAAAVVMEGDTLHYVDPDGRHQRVALKTVDGEATRRVNRERNLQLQLPRLADR